MGQRFSCFGNSNSFLHFSFKLKFFGYYQVFLKDTDERACAYIAGPAPNRWGFTFDGNDLFESFGSLSSNDRECFHHILGFIIATSVKFFNLFH